MFECVLRDVKLYSSVQNIIFKKNLNIMGYISNHKFNNLSIIIDDWYSNLKV